MRALTTSTASVRPAIGQPHQSIHQRHFRFRHQTRRRARRCDRLTSRRRPRKSCRRRSKARCRAKVSSCSNSSTRCPSSSSRRSSSCMSFSEFFTRAMSIRSLCFPRSFPRSSAGLLTLWLFGSTLSLYSVIGLFLLMGIVKKNGIMIVDFALHRLDEGYDRRSAIHEASVERFRPIIMTTLAALMGALPLALGYGADGSSRRPLGLVIVGGPDHFAVDHALHHAGDLSRARMVPGERARSRPVPAQRHTHHEADAEKHAAAPAPEPVGAR